MAKDNSTYLALNAIFQEVHDPKKYDKFEEYRKKNQKESKEKPTTNLQQTYNNPAIDNERKPTTENEFKPATNIQQTYNKPTTENKVKPTTNLQQTYNKPITNIQQTYNKPISEPTTNLQQTYNNKIENKPNLHHISGLQREILFLIYKECTKNRSIITSSLPTNFFVSSLKSNYGSIKTTIYRLKKIGLLELVDFKGGRGGWSIYKLSENMYRQINTHMEFFPTTNLQQTYNKPMSEPTTKAPCSSSYDYNNEITTTTELPPDWQSIDFCKLNEKIYFGMNDLKNIYKAGKLTSAEFQQSIHGFSYRLENDEKFRNEIKNKKSYFMSTSLNGGSFHDPEKVQILKKQKEAEEMMAQYQEQDRLRAIQDRQREENFRVWCDGLNPQKKDEILAKLSPDENTFIHHKAALYKYYEDNELES